jgi:hypothetical protein
LKQWLSIDQRERHVFELTSEVVDLLPTTMFDYNESLVNIVVAKHVDNIFLYTDDSSNTKKNDYTKKADLIFTNISEIFVQSMELFPFSC